MDELETLLRQFRPRRPGPLPDVEHGRGPRRLAWVVLSGVAAAVVMMVVWRPHTPVPETARTAFTLGELNAFDANALETVLVRTSRAILPDVERPGGALHALSKE